MQPRWECARVSVSFTSLGRKSMSLGIFLPLDPYPYMLVKLLLKADNRKTIDSAVFVPC